MQIINQIGHIQHWGLSPATNMLKYQPKSHKGQPLRILMSGCSDIRHILKTICDINLEQIESKNKKYQSIEIYVHEPNKELLCRCLLFLHIIHQTHLNFDERIQLFLDLYGNAMIKQRNARYLHGIKQDLLNFIHDEKKISTPIKQFVSLKHLKFEERDEMSQIIKSWSMKVPLDMQKLRDTKLRYLYKERYDYRSNLIDWDFNMFLNACAPIIHYYHYKEWRLTGLAYEQRFSKYTQPNRTLSSYAPGRKRQQRTSCLVRGYWGDIIISPYISIGTKCDYKQSDLLYKKANLKYIGHSIQIAQYNMNYWLQMIQKNKQYNRVFRDYYRCDQQTKKQLQTKNQQKKKKKGKEGQNLKQIKEQEQQQIKQQNKEQTEEIAKQTKEASKNGKEQQLDSDEQEQKKKVQIYNSKQIVNEQTQRQVLKGFKNYNLSIHLMGMNSQKLVIPKYKQYFDVVMLGFVHSAYLTKGIKSLIKQKGSLLCESATYLIAKKNQQRKQLNEKLKKLIQDDGLFQCINKEDPDVFVYEKK